jgi:hypothetical protein
MTDTSKTISHIIETGESPYTVNIKVNGFTFKGDEPESFGGGNTGRPPMIYCWQYSENAPQ